MIQTPWVSTKLYTALALGIVLSVEELEIVVTMLIAVAPEIEVVLRFKLASVEPLYESEVEPAILMFKACSTLFASILYTTPQADI